MKDSIEVYLLGTGGPEYTANRLGISTLVMISGETFLFDVGRGATQRLFEAGIPLCSVDKIFFTHMHSDHVEGLPNLWLSPWFLLGRKTNLKLWGPPGTKVMAKGMKEMFTKDYEARSNRIFLKSYLDLDIVEFSQEGVVYDDGKVKILAFPVEHADGNPAYGYRLEYKDYSILFSGDTTYHKNVVKYGDHCDLLLHNVIGTAPQKPGDDGLGWSAVLAKLTTPQQAASIFMETNPRLAVFTHICKKGMPGREGDARILEMVREAGYSGALEMGYDGMKIAIGESIRITPPRPRESVSDLQ